MVASDTCSSWPLRRFFRYHSPPDRGTSPPHLQAEAAHSFHPQGKIELAAMVLYLVPRVD